MKADSVSSKKPRPARRLAPPAATVRRETRVVHGETLSDDYGWMRAENWKEVLRNPDALPADIQSHLLAENAYAKTLMAPTRALQRIVLKEMRGRIREDDTSVPQRDGAFLYYQRYRRGGEHPLVCRKPVVPAKGRNGGEQVMLDADALARGKDFFDLGEVLHAPCHKLLAWSADEQGSELYAIRIRDITTGEDLADIVPDTTGELVWANDSRSFCYVRLDADHRPSIVMRHRLGTDAKTDEV
ncbi:MAG: S9 family peptidase, partial [Bosea sp. (in: a-proteobacteria)]